MSMAKAAEEPNEEFDLVIIGAGLYGIQAARTYLEVHPGSNVVVFDGGSSVGGVWSQDRVYDEFWTQTPVGIAEFSDKPLVGIAEADSYYGFFPARYISQYLDEYTESHVYSGTSLSSRIRTHSRVVRLEKVPSNGQWLLQICTHGAPQTHVTGTTYRVTTPRVIDASGLTSSPNIPSIPGLDTFKGEKVHQMEVAKSGLLSNSERRHVVVLGGAKSAADLAYAFAKAGKHVSWVIRKSGAGPASFTTAEGSGRYRNSNESFYTRLTALFLASIFSGTSRSRWSLGSCVESMLYRTTIGMAVFSWIWKRITERAWQEAGYTRRQKVPGEAASGDQEQPRGKGFHLLQPDTSIFWQNDSSGINQRDDFFSTVADKVAVYREDIECIGDKEVRLADERGTCLSADVIILATGWDVQASFAHLDDATASRLGLPVPKNYLDKDDDASWAALEFRAESEVLKRFPILAHPPPCRESPTLLSPFRLYKGMLPVSDHSIVFLGKIMLGNHFRAAEVQALWALGVLDWTLKLPTESAMRMDVAQTVGWCRKRYLSKGHLGNWFWFDMVPYTDMLLEQLGLHSHRRSRRWFGRSNLLAPCFASDLRNLITEYRAKYPHVER